MPAPSSFLIFISHTRALKRSRVMLSILILAAVAGAWRIARLALQGLRELPRANEDMVFF